jgi:hypothetical protein
MTSEAEILANISRTFLMLDALRARFRTAEAPPCGSELARADAVWPHYPFTEHARQALASAWDHFCVVRLVIEARRMFPTGVNGVLRGGLVAASLALWLLGPDDPDVRDQRGLAVTDEWYWRRISFQRDYMASRGELAEDGAASAQLELLERHRVQAGQLRTAATKVQATDIVDWSASHLWGPKSSQRSDALLEWKRLGGDAHALGWQLLLQDVAWGEGDVGPVQAQITGSLANVASPYLYAWSMFDAALRRFDLLRDAPASDGGEADLL